MKDWKPPTLIQMLERIKRQAVKLQMDSMELQYDTLLAKRMHRRARYVEAMAAAVLARFEP